MYINKEQEMGLGRCGQVWWSVGGCVGVRVGP